MAFKLTPEAQARAAEYKAWETEQKAKFAALNNESLVVSAKLYIAHMSPMHFAPGEPIYDATMWHIILPELLDRVRNGGDA
ncbi:hypothetical protein [Neorhizobium galegae]|uniref:hypothetical protein n=1 Tax=Neorhizobium galegae TaxID=399 RepID=UPI000621C79C|nr:hypothetical protein [Neorhizobium galegae]CDZ55073.1 Hypothetical protein NGAL_HAMBI2427_59810 [Neorhizobium galegae bv. orientalis]